MSRRPDEIGRISTRTGILAGVGLLVLLLAYGLGWAFHPSSSSTTKGSGASQTAPARTALPSGGSADSLADQKLKADIALTQAQQAQTLQQTQSARAADALWRQLLTPGGTILVGALTAIVALLSILIPLKNQREKDRQQRADDAAKDITQRDQDRQQRADDAAKDRQQRFDTGFAAALPALGDTNPAIQAGAAAALQSYVRPDLDDEFVERVYLVARSNLDLGIDHPDLVRSLLVGALSRTLQRSRPASMKRPTPRIRSTGRGDGPDLARAWLRGGDFRGVDLSSADLAFSDLRGARLDDVRLRRAWGWAVNLGGAHLRNADLEEGRFRRAQAPKAVFDNARLVSARFEEANLRGARFRAAFLQAAHFDNAQLDGADFRDANIDDTYFRGAAFDDPALKTLLLSASWPLDDAVLRRHFDATAVERLLELTPQKVPGTGDSTPKDVPTPA